MSAPITAPTSTCTCGKAAGLRADHEAECAGAYLHAIAPLTARQVEVLRFICAHVDREGYPPSVREIGHALGITSTNGVADHLASLVAKGFISVRPHTARGIKVLRRPA